MACSLPSELWWLVVVISVALGVSGGAILAAAAQKSYVATATVALRWVGADPGVAEPSNVKYMTERARTYVLLTQYQPVLERAIERSGLSLTAAQLKNRLGAEVPLDSQLIQVHGWSSDPEQSVTIADAVAAALADEIYS